MLYSLGTRPLKCSRQTSQTYCTHSKWKKCLKCLKSYWMWSHCFYHLLGPERFHDAEVRVGDKHQTEMAFRNNQLCYFFDGSPRLFLHETCKPTPVQGRYASLQIVKPHRERPNYIIELNILNICEFEIYGLKFWILYWSRSVVPVWN